MKIPSPLTLGAFGALALASAAALASRSTASGAQAAPGGHAQHHGEAAQSGLRRVPAAEVDAPAADAVAPSSDFDAAAWTERLSAAELDERERAFDELLQLARRDAAVRAWLEQRARESGELAWTSRMALRALPPAHAPFGMGRMDAMDDLRARIEQLQQRLEQLGGPGTQAMPRAFRFSIPPQAFAPGAAPRGSAPQAGTSSRESIELQSGPDGCVLKITRGEGQDERVEEYQADSLDELLEAHPELRAQLGQQGWPLALELEGLEDLRALRGFGSGGAIQRVLPSGPLGWSWQGTPGAAAQMRTDLLGVWIDPLDAERRAQLELPEGRGLLVARVEPFTLASLLGIAAGDVLVELNGRAIASRDDVSAALAAREPQGELRATWFDSMNQKRTRTWRPVTNEGAEAK